MNTTLRSFECKVDPDGLGVPDKEVIFRGEIDSYNLISTTDGVTVESGSIKLASVEIWYCGWSFRPMITAKNVTLDEDGDMPSFLHEQVALAILDHETSR